jgi:hypothetical protein
MEEFLRGNDLIHLEDLKFGPIAQSKLLQNKMLKEFQNINRMDDVEVRQIAMQDYIQNLESIENNFDERDARIEAGDNFEYY